MATTSGPVVIGEDGLVRLIRLLTEHGYWVVGPTVRDDAIVLAEVDSVACLPAGWGVDVAPGRCALRRREDRAMFAHSAGPQSWKQFLQPPRRLLWSGEFEPPAPETPRYAFPAGAVRTPARLAGRPVEYRPRPR